jgi:predicted nucleic acid-binding protein
MFCVVVDANIVTKTFLSESDTQAALDLFGACLTNEARIIAPDLLKYEVVQTALRHKVSVEKVFQIFEDHTSTLVDQLSPNLEVWQKAKEIFGHGHVKSGYPQCMTVSTTLWRLLRMGYL